MSKAVNRIARVLGAFSGEEPTLSLTECSRRAGLTKSTAHRLLLSLEAEGLAERSGDAWRLGPAVVTLATTRLGGLELRREALPHLRAIRSTFQSAAALAVPDGYHMLHVEQPDAPDAVGVSARLGSRVPMWASAAGMIVLAYLSDDERAARLDVEDWHRIPTETRRRIEQDVAIGAETGFCVDRGEFFDGVGSVAAGVRNSHGEPVAAIAVIESSEHLTDRHVGRVARRLQEAAGAVETAMGFRLTPVGERVLDELADHV